MSEKFGKRWLVSRRSQSSRSRYGTFELGRASAGYFVVSSMLERLDLQQAQPGAAGGERVAAPPRRGRRGRPEGRPPGAVGRAADDGRAAGGNRAPEAGARSSTAAWSCASTVPARCACRSCACAPEEEERRYLVLITLVQAATRDTVANGTVTFAVEGKQGKEAATLPLAGNRDRQAQAVPVLAALLPADRGADRAAAGFRARAPPCGVPARAQSRADEADVRLARGRRGTRRRFDPPRAGSYNSTAGSTPALGSSRERIGAENRRPRLHRRRRAQGRAS